MSASAIAAAPPAAPASPETLGLVRHNVKELLGQSAAFRALPPERQKEIARQTVEVASYLAEPEGIRADKLRPDADPYAMEQSTAALRGGGYRSGSGSGPPEFKAQAATEGARVAGMYLKEVNFPAFVSGLINGVFHSIVQSSIEQMEAYGRLVADVAKTLNQFRDENVSVNQGRDHLVEQFPDTFFLDMDTGGDEGPRVRVREGADERAALRRINELPLEGGPVTSLDDDIVEERLVPAARTQLATSRQQLLATMVLMGINRIVVSDGRIAAKVVFDFQARDNFRYQESATKFDYDPTLKKRSAEGEHEVERQGAEYDINERGKSVKTRDASYYSKGSYKWSEEPVMTLASASQLQNDAALTTKAQLTGSVEVNFKSDYLPLEKMADSFQIAQIQQASKPNETRQAPRGAAAAPAPAA